MSNLTVLTLGIFGLFATHARSDQNKAEWIWSDAPRESPSAVSFAKSFPIEGDLQSATLRVAGDFCRFECLINGEPAALLEPYDDHIEKSVNSYVSVGENRIELNATGVSGPSAIAIEIECIYKDGTRSLLNSGTDWLTRPLDSDGKWHPASSFGPLASLGWRSPEALPEIGAFDEYNQWKEALGAAGDKTAATFSQLPDGFEIELLRAATDDEGSWVSMAFDPEGRIVIARETRGLLRAALAEEGKSVKTVEVIDDTLLECRGLLFAHGALYANANNSKALYRLRDTTGDDQFDEVTLLKETGGGVGHGRNDLALGPDGMIYAIQGDSVEIPPGSQFRTPPTAEKFPHEGHFVRTDKDGKTWEIVATGLRNPFGIDFHPDGEPFTYDADNESDIGLPFYRPTRVNHLVSGADYGWRQGGQSWPVYAPDSLPTTLDIGHGSPTAVKFGTRSNFPSRYRNALFILDWAYGRIIAVDTIARGASYTCRAHTFLRGRPLNVTDLDFGPDGAMYFVTGGRKTRSALYRVRFTGPSGQPVAQTAQERARAAFSEKARQQRRTLEEFHRPDAPADGLPSIWPALTDPDPSIRHAARIALEHQPIDRWYDKAFTDPATDPATFPALLALSRTGEADVLPNVADWLLHLPLPDLSARDQLSVLRSLSICRRRNCPMDHELIGRIVGQIDPVLPSISPALNREITALLIESDAPSAIEKSLNQLAKATSQPDHLYYLDLLSKAADHPGWTLPQRETFFLSLRTAHTFTGDQSLPGFIAAIRERALKPLTESERKALAEVTEPDPPAPPIPDPTKPPRKLVKHWTIADFSTTPDESAGDPLKKAQRGREIFESALCVRCHQIGSLGTPVGPNLSAVSSRFSRSDLLAAIIGPSTAVAEIYQTHVVTKKDGTVLMGRVIHNNLRDSTFTIAPDPFAPWQTETISKNDIERHEISPASPMPANLLDTFTLEEIQNLLAFLEAGGSR